VSLACPSLNNLSDISSMMANVDCESAAFVASVYDGLFGAGGGLTQILVGALTIYVAFFGYRLIIGAGSLTAPDLVRRFAGVGVILALSSNWPAYQTIFVNTVTGGAEEIASLMSAAATGRADTSSSIAVDIGFIIDQMTGLASEWSLKPSLAAAPAEVPTGATAIIAPPSIAPASVSAVNMLWLSAILLGVSSAGVIIITKITLAFLLALGPVFLILALFPSARGLFEGWLRTIVAGAFVLAFTILASGGAVSVIAPIAETIDANQSRGVNDSGPVFTLLVVCIVFAMLIRQVLAMTARLTAAWRLPFFADTRPTASTEQVVEPARTSQPFADERIAGIVASLSRDDAALAPPRTTAVASRETALRPFDDDADAGPTRRAARAYRGFGSSRVRAAGVYR